MDALTQTSIKICGVTRPKEIIDLDNLGVTYAGLWCGVPKGDRNLDMERLIDLSLMPTKALKFILVTLENSMAFFKAALKNAHINGVQFHGFQLPSLIKKVKTAFGDSIKIFKVLHIQSEQCVEDTMVERYLDAGVDILVLDCFQGRMKLGSTGTCLSENFLSQFISCRVSADKIMIAGGVDEKNIADLCISYRPYGIDIDTAARCNGVIHKERVASIIGQLS